MSNLKFNLYTYKSRKPRSLQRMKHSSQKSMNKAGSNSQEKLEKNIEDGFRTRRSSVNSKIIQNQSTNKQFNSIDSAKLQFKKLVEKSDQLKQPGTQPSQIKSDRKNKEAINWMLNSKLSSDLNVNLNKQIVELNQTKQNTSHQKDKSQGQSFKNSGYKPQANNETKPIDNIIGTILGTDKANQPRKAQDLIKSMLSLGGALRSHQYQNPAGTEYFKDKMIKITSSCELSEQHQKKNGTSLWLGQVYDKCTSSAFKNYICHDLDYNQTKSYCCEQIISNLLDEITRRNKSNHQNSKFSRRESNQSLEDQVEKNAKKKIIYETEPMKFINDESGKILAYLCSKYPQTNVQGVNKQVAQIVETIKIDNWANDEYDLLRLSGVKFAYKQSGDYSPQIMKFLNFLMQLPLKPHKNFPNLTNYKFFELVMRKILSIVFIKDTKNDVSHILNEKDEINLETKLKSNMTQQQEEYFQKIKKETTILIGCKIPPSARHFSKEDIESGIIKVEDNAISRVIDKWAEQLSSKFSEAETNVLNRNYRFKSADSCKFFKVPKQPRAQLFKILQQKKKDIQDFIKELKESLYDLSSKLALNAESDVSDLKFIDQAQKMFGEFAVKMSQSSSQYFIQILQKQINLLLQSIEILKQRWLAKYKFKQLPIYEALNISLITFKIGDLFRCKIISNENQIARVLKLIMLLSEMWGNKLIKIIRVKNRLESGTRDVLINFMFDQICPCQIQLAVAEKMQQKQGYFDKFNHFLYELKRAYLGPVMEMCKIWRQYEGKSQTYAKMIQKSIDKKIKKKIINNQFKNLNLQQNSIVFEYKFPFICSSCQIFYPQSSLIYFASLINGKIYCGNCCKIKIALQNQNSAETKKKFIFRKYISRYPNFYKVMKHFYELNNLTEMVNHKYQVHIPISSRIIHMHYTFMLKLERASSQNQEEYEYDQYVFVSTKMTEQGKILKEFCSQKVSRIEKSNSSLKSIMSIDQASEAFNQNYIFYGWNAPTKLMPLPQSPKDHYLELIQKFIPHLRLLQQQKQYRNLKICAVEVEEQKYYYLPLFMLDEEEISIQVLKQNNLEYILKNVQKRKEVLEIQNKEITTQWTELPINIKLKIAYTVKQIYLNKNNIRQANFIENFHGLKIFHADNNLIKQIPKIPIGLEQISLNYNRIQAINEFVPLQNVQEYNLTALVIGSNPIRKIQNISHLKNLTHLFLGRCKIKKIEGIPYKIQYLGFPFNQITKIENLQKLTCLTRLSLVSNSISKIQNLENCKGLQILLLSQNNICTIENLEGLQNLTVLHLSFTGLVSSGSKTCLSYKGLKGLKKLKRLMLQGNKIQCLLQMAGISEEDFQNKSYLNICFMEMRELSVIQNQISYIDGIQKFMPYLEIMNISKNGVTSIDHALNLSLLTSFDASYNKIEQLPETGWEKLFKLKNLNLSHNQIKIMPDLAPLLFLKSMNFESNKISQVRGFPGWPFGQPDFVRIIKLDKNCLFEEQTSSDDFKATINSIKLLNSPSLVSMLDNGYSRQKIQTIHSIKQQLRLLNMIVSQMPLLNDNFY